FQNVDGSVAVVFINGGTSTVSVQVKTTGGAAFAAAGAAAFLTDNTHDFNETTASFSGGAASASIPGRSIVSIMLR
ncbi:hypothetical protein E0Z10_g8981, partial [Xylaria hypoxylon]